MSAGFIWSPLFFFVMHCRTCILCICCVVIFFIHTWVQFWPFSPASACMPYCFSGLGSFSDRNFSEFMLDIVWSAALLLVLFNKFYYFLSLSHLPCVIQHLLLHFRYAHHNKYIKENKHLAGIKGLNISRGKTGHASGIVACLHMHICVINPPRFWLKSMCLHDLKWNSKH